jgi:hypothetical protein
MTKTIILGDEFDDVLKDRLINKLKLLGAIPLSSDWSVAGSQELSSLSVRLGNEVIEIASETFIGLSISGPDELVDEIAAFLA